MASIGRCTLSAFSGTQEVTAALANFQFDFSMVKVIAPDEYKSIGQHLSKKRKSSAEDGSFHRTARKLGALFEGALPEVPHLVRAYGLRASEISENPENNPAGSRRHGALEDHIGVDCRAHWAAATSGPSALPLLLLACILARSWRSVEAVPIWTELVNSRKAILQQRLHDSHINLNEMTASRLEIPREDLAEWDASARAWLNVADRAQSRQQIQLMLIINNLEMSLNPRLEAHDSIMEVWTEAMTTVNSLVSGLPMRLQNPHVLVGLAAWHLFPDISILGQEQKCVMLNDHLVARGGLLTIGMQTISPEVPTGISWTLPLKDIRFYGVAKLTRGGFNTSSTNVSFEKFVQVAIGSLVSQWRRSSHNFASLVAFLAAFGRKAGTEKPEKWKSPEDRPEIATMFPALKDFSSEVNYDNWPQSFLHGVPHHRKEFERCSELGGRRFTNFFAPFKDHPPVAFGLCDPRHLLSMMSPEHAISALRHLVARFNHDIALKNAFILLRGSGWEEIVSLEPITQPNSVDAQFARWVVLTPPNTPEQTFQPSNIVRMMKFEREIAENPRDYKSSEVLRSFTIMKSLHERCGFVTPFPHVTIQPTSWNAHEALRYAEESPDFNSGRDGIQPNQLEDITSKWLSEPCSSWIASDYESLWEFDYFSLYVPTRDKWNRNSLLPLDFVTEILNSDLIKPQCVSAYFEKELYIGTEAEPNKRSQYYESLVVLGRASDLYENLQGAIVNLSVLSIPLHSVRWLPRYLDPLNIREAFSCIAMFATGLHNLEPGIFSTITGLSYGNTMYMLEVLLNDPWTCLQSDDLRNRICCLVGNVGRPGLSLLLPVGEPMKHEVDLDSWNLINHEAFNGRLEDNFRSTALQLSLTGYSQPIDTNEHGTRDKDVFYVETIISVHDHGKWIEDIGILPLYERKKSAPYIPLCSHTEQERNEFSQLGRVRSVDSWVEFLDPPLDPCIIRAHDNWIARLAISAVGCAQNYRILISGPDICWTCIRVIVAQENWPEFEVMIIC